MLNLYTYIAHNKQNKTKSLQSQSNSNYIKILNEKWMAKGRIKEES